MAYHRHWRVLFPVAQNHERRTTSIETRIEQAAHDFAAVAGVGELSVLEALAQRAQRPDEMAWSLDDPAILTAVETLKAADLVAGLPSETCCLTPRGRELWMAVRALIC